MSVYTNDKVNAFVLKEVYRQELKEWLAEIEGSKVLVCDEDFNSTFDLIVDPTFLKECSVVQKITLSKSPKNTPKFQHIIFLIKPCVSLVDHVFDYINKHNTGGDSSTKKFHLLFIPRKSLLCEKRIKELGLSSLLSSTDHIQMDILPLTSDLLSMEYDTAYRECYLEDDPSCLFHVCRSVSTIQSLFGTIPNLYAKGNLANRVVDMLVGMRKELGALQPSLPPCIDNLLLLDRSVDPLTPLLTQLTYEGLIDELYGIHKGIVQLPADRFTTDQPTNGNPNNPFETSTLRSIHLSPSDDLYTEIRDKNFNAVGNCINQRVKSLSTQYDERHAAKTVGEIKKFVAKIAHIRATKSNLATHTTIAEMVKEATDEEGFRGFLAEQQDCLDGDVDRVRPYIEESIAMKKSLVMVLRLICLQCFVNNGLKAKVMEFYKREIIQTYGFQHLVSLCNMEKCGLIYTQNHLKTFPLLKRQLKLSVKDVNEQNPDDISYVYSGYAPISVRLAQILNKSDWRSIPEVINTILPGAVREEVQPIAEWLLKKPTKGKASKVTLVFFIGGVTYSEVSALRFLSQQEDSNSEYLIATTHLINSNTYLSSIMQELKPRPPSSTPQNPFL